MPQHVCYVSPCPLTQHHKALCVNPRYATVAARRERKPEKRGLGWSTSGNLNVARGRGPVYYH
eukprot:2445984-Rhodomonas_salina.2